MDEGNSGMRDEGGRRIGVVRLSAHPSQVALQWALDPSNPALRLAQTVGTLADLAKARWKRP